MTKTYQLALHIFRRDLRLQDNSGLIEALRSAAKVIPCFIFDKRQIERNDYKSDHAIQFMTQTLFELNEQLKEKNGRLYFFYGIAEDVVSELLNQLKVDAVFINRDYTPFSIQRDRLIEAACQKKGIDFHCYADALLNEPEQALKPNGEPYTIFTPFFRRSSLLDVAAPRRNTYDNYYNKPIASEDNQTLARLMQKQNPNLLVKGGRAEGIQLLKRIPELKDYADIRNIPALPGTTKLSAHHKFGSVSIRETYNTVVKTFGKQHTLITELYWRDFFTHITFHFPHVLQGAFQARYDKLPWTNNENYFRAWCEGRTGFPIVDAGMRELNTTGYMHNRVRMIVASFLTKDLHIDWRWGEKYFAQKLVDYDVAVNNGGWQWGASTGCDAQPYFRIFNPWLQQQKFDPDCIYIKRWIPELNRLSPKQIHQLEKITPTLLTNYPKTLINHSQESIKIKAAFKNIS